MTHPRIAEALVAGILILAMPALAEERFTLDPTHTFPSFEIRHHGVSTFRGKFNRSQGRAVLDPQGGGGLVEVVVDAASVDTGLDDLDRKLRGVSFFATGSFPDIRFRSTQIKYRDGKPVAAVGELTMLGVTKPLELEIRDYACTQQFLTRRPLCGADVHATLRRSDFNMNFGIPLIGDEVRLAIEVEGFKE